jgi:SecD/SecF fusion protein
MKKITKETTKTTKNITKEIMLCLSILFVTVIGALYLFKDIKFGLDLKGGFEILYEVKDSKGKEASADAVQSTYRTLSRRVDSLGVSEPILQIEGSKIRVKLAGVFDENSAVASLNRAASLSFRDTEDNLLMDASVLKAGGAKVSNDEYGNYAVSLSVDDKAKFYQVTKEISEKENNQIVIWLDFTEGMDSYSASQSTCGNLTEKNLSSIKCLSAASVSQGFASDVIIQGNFKKEDVENLVELINSGSLTTSLEEVYSNTVDATFGQNSLEKTALAGGIGILLIILFMILTYRFTGLIASITMAVYTVSVLFIFWLIGGILTLPGIAAIIIGIGMAVDSVVISCARIKDELKLGSKLPVAFTNGNKNSFTAIFDSNITTLLVAIILFIFSESAVKGFATMLIISTLVTMVIMVFVNRYLLGLFIKTEYFNDKLYSFIGYKEKKRTNEFNFIKAFKLSRFVAIFIILAFVASLFTFKLNLGIDFKGGSTISLSADNLTKEKLAEDIKGMGYEVVNIDEYNGTLTANINSELENVGDINKKEEIKTYFKEKYEADAQIGVVTNIAKKEMVKNAFISSLVALIGMIIYVSLRYSLEYSLSAILALIFNVIFTILIFSIFKLEINSMFIAAILSILGYSINDTIVVFDRIRENIKKKYDDKIKKKEELTETFNLSLNQTVKRSIYTTITTILPIITLILIGSKEIFNFNLALLVGLTCGTIATLFLSSQVLYLLEKRNIGKIKKKWYEE